MKSWYLAQKITVFNKHVYVLEIHVTILFKFLKHVGSIPAHSGDAAEIQ